MANKRCHAADLTEGHRLSRISYYEVLENDRAEERIKVRNQNGETWWISDGILEDETFSAHQVRATKRINKTEMAQLLQHQVKDSVFTVVFEKKMDPKDVEATLHAKYEAGGTLAKRRKVVKEALHGELRTLVGYLKHYDPVMGRLIVYDLEKAAPNNERQVNQQTLHELVFRNTKYVLKK
jgi:hypothetical protein